LDKTQEKAADDDVARAALVDLQQKYTESQTQLATVQQQLASFQSEEKVEDHPDIESQLSALGVDNGEVTTPAGAVDAPAPAGDMTPVAVTESAPAAAESQSAPAAESTAAGSV
jgi:hypothetical protein